MILPTKGITSDRALISIGARVLQLLTEPKTVSRIWDEYRKGIPSLPTGVTFDWFVLSLDLLFALGTIELNRGRIHRVTAMEDSSP
ncbi:MAG TPA: ABC-three component system middle component 6 [Polyangiaceae bacterium]|nr:ABC-three component system middle component 6 [Polyangiaceae bacterium]